MKIYLVRIWALPISSRTLIACGVWLVALGLYFIFLRAPLLPEDLRFIGASAAQLQFAAPGLARWLNMVFIVRGGFMAAAGVLTVFIGVAIGSMPSRSNGTVWVLAVAGALSVELMSYANFSLHSDYQWLLLVPASVWLAGVVLYTVGQ
ncbi:hypothetical protein QN397_17360 [Variovorax sp. RTB1]|uniref:hypothetical protein n=1 Tax=Variovorax sp. RTB1 TaxID=3048631 RepID=UPI002B225030|nr:hypothetical protein [Variovorax sp. RTB1]MEB0113121.1 hypothetical protein [Variovorax sp. RTB1]